MDAQGVDAVTRLVDWRRKRFSSRLGGEQIVDLRLRKSNQYQTLLGRIRLAVSEKLLPDPFDVVSWTEDQCLARLQASPNTEVFKT